MELFVFIVFQLLIEVQSYEPPTVKVSPDVIRESSSVKISCETPEDVTVNQCYFYPNKEKNQTKNKWDCILKLTGAEVFRWAAVKSPGSLNIYCYYTIYVNNESLPHSLPATVTVLALPEAKLSVSASVILETDTVELSCENTEDLKMKIEMCVFIINGRESNSKLSSSCQLSLTGSQISIWSGDQSSSVTITCFYTVMKRRTQIPSNHSDPVIVTVEISKSTTTKQTTTTAIKTTLAVMFASETTTYNKTGLHSTTNLSTSKTNETMISTTSSTLPGDSKISEHNSTETPTRASEMDTCE
ncbi:uncharacterized protein LOC127158048 [Labeo rohita]|uniref:uncharacterized protein LOC127158048 n=1 Tax=Labeo rohita TaxID=84645 RepID=UPI0021E26745|nr:uncharacterized protein LOC127158048 [Labeo rohita]